MITILVKSGSHILGHRIWRYIGRRERYRIPLHEVTSVEDVGGKAFNLSSVHTLGMRVPESVVILTAALSEFLDVNGLKRVIRNYQRAFETETNKELTDRYFRLCRRVQDGVVPAAIGDEIQNMAERLLDDTPGGLAIRSSARVEDDRDASFARVFESFLGCLEASQVSG